MPDTFCARGHKLRFDQNRGRLVCDTCEGQVTRGQRPVSSSRPSKAGGSRTLRLTGLSVPIAKIPELPKSEGEEVVVSSPRALNSEASVPDFAPLVLVESGKPARQGKLALQPGKQSVAIPQKEADVQRGTIDALFQRGYLVFENTVHLKSQLVTCTNCHKRWHQTPNYATGQTPGIPDLDCLSPKWRHPLLPATLWLGLEQKGTRGVLSDEQNKLREDGHTVVSKSVETNLAAARQTDLFFEYLADLESLRQAVSNGDKPRQTELLARLSLYKNDFRDAYKPKSKP